MSAATPDVLIAGAGPAGLIAADRLSELGLAVEIRDRMPSPARKFLLAGRGGLNLTHSEPLDVFLGRYREAAPTLEPAIRAFDPDALRAWCAGLGQETFVGSSGRVFPVAMKTSPLLRALLGRLASRGIVLHPRQTWAGFADDGRSRFRAADGAETLVAARATLLAFGGASWPRLGATGDWAPALQARGVCVRPFVPSNCGFAVGWSRVFRERFAGTPLKRLAASHDGERIRGEAVVTEAGIEGGAVYALSAPLRRTLQAEGEARLVLDLRPDLAPEALTARLARPRGKQSLSTFLRKAAGLNPVEVALLREAGPVPDDPAALADRIKGVTLRLVGAAPIERAISSAGGVALDEIDAQFMLRKLPGVFVAGEMLDWEAPTGGYLLQACFATGRAAAEGIAGFLAHRKQGWAERGAR
ncbi:TIGR03862 family flavoprotein [Polymorphum gilvum]|uniref:Putative fad-dependent pyridine nucleotide-disulfide oxidoreductase transmembrane protein n=1 Tax=Polymorphum gilvum (strain LMG 25793 / CGMCC 1.9160 / SL003B-26A1) TaxID=991905 RepID=F2J114_POLGS|nr:TIGR03862 family flavoprotein [Polymorphum gilvum]ADZ71960.1 Putative fad-dependent pyridine nucleotide-disulfide oxidoreductase; transmembrane protein [Polymorphum gilvum SL003B-26A1]